MTKPSCQSAGKGENMFLKKERFRPDEAALILLVTRQTIYRMIQDGRLPGVDKTKRPWLIPREDIMALIVNREER